MINIIEVGCVDRVGFDCDVQTSVFHQKVRGHMVDEKVRIRSCMKLMTIGTQ